MTSVLRLGPYSNSDMASQSRAAQRKQKLLEIEQEQQLEEAEALKITPEERRILYQSFQSVKVEFSDLDGLSWKGVRLPQSPPGLAPTPALKPIVEAPFAGLRGHLKTIPGCSEETKDFLKVVAPASFDDTIRGSTSFPPSRPRLTSQFRPTPVVPTASTLSVPRKRAPPAADVNAAPGHVSKSPRPTPPEEPTKPSSVVSTSQGYESDSDRTICGSSDEELLPTSPRRERRKQKSRRASTKVTYPITLKLDGEGWRHFPWYGHEISLEAPREGAVGLPQSSSAPTTPAQSPKLPFPYIGAHPNPTPASN